MLKKSLTDYVDDAYPLMARGDKDRLVESLIRMISGWGQAAPEDQARVLKAAIDDIRRQFANPVKTFVIEWTLSSRSRSEHEVKEAAERHAGRFVDRFTHLFPNGAKIEPELQIEGVSRIDAQMVSVRSRFKAYQLSERMLRRVTATIGKDNKRLAIAKTRYERLEATRPMGEKTAQLSTSA